MKKELTASNVNTENRMTAVRRKSPSNNQIVRQALAQAGLFNWQLADICGCSVDTIQRKLRHELPESEQRRIARLIREATNCE